ncbi:cache domain-containing protein [Colwellia sp. MB3u-28]|nr:cache domain-containing protein [Colwellia sp. MB3u-28]MBA6260112.1 cache domain-containing protein [Colwellia sp. MB3u-41]
MSVYQTLYTQQQEKVQQEVEGAVSILEHFHQLQLSGKIIEKQAQEQAISILSSFRYDNNNDV